MDEPRMTLVSPTCSRLRLIKETVEKIVAEVVKRDMERMENLKKVVEVLDAYNTKPKE
jgi:hypothetical protein